MSCAKGIYALGHGQKQKSWTVCVPLQAKFLNFHCTDSTIAHIYLAIRQTIDMQSDQNV